MRIVSRNFYLVLALCPFLFGWLLPNHYPPWASGIQDFLAFFAVFLLWVFFPVSLRLDWRLLIVFLVVCIPILQWFAGKIFFWGDAFLASAYLLFFLLAIIFSSGLSGGGVRKQFLSVFFLFLVFASVLSVWITIRQWLLLSGSLWEMDIPPGGRPFANIAQPNNLATLLIMGFVGVMYFYEKNKLGRLGFYLLVFLLLLGVALTQSRTPWVVLPALIFYWKIKYWRNSRITGFGSIGLVVIYAGLVVILPELSKALLLPVSSPYERAQSFERLDLWRQLIYALLDGPLWGYGWNQVSVAQTYISQPHPVALMTEHSHNILLDILLWNGPVLGGAIIMFLGCWLISLLWRSRSIEALCALMAACAVILHGMLEFPLEYAFFLFPVGLLLGVAIAETSTAELVRVSPYLKSGFLCVLAVLLLWSWIEYRIVEEDHRLMRFQTARIGTSEVTRATAPVKFFTQLSEFVRFARTPAMEHMSEEELEWMHKVARRYPYPPSLFRYSLALGLNGHVDKAREQLSILRALHGEKHYFEALRSMELAGERYPQLREISINYRADK